MAKITYAHVFASAGFSGEAWDVSAGPANTDIQDVLLSIGSGALTEDTPHSLWSTGALAAGTAEQTDITIANPGSFFDVVGPAKYLTVHSANPDQTHYFWFKVTDGANVQTDPAPGGVGHMVSILLADIAAQIAGKYQVVTAALAALFTATILGAVVSVTNASGGNVPDATANTSGATILVNTQGSAGVTLDISAMEVETAAKGAQALNGRFFHFSVQNTNISPSNPITVVSSATINGAASFVISSTGDYLFTHHSAGKWRANVLEAPTENLASFKRIPFLSTDWDANTGMKNTIKVIQAGSPGLGEVGPHGLAAYGSYLVQVINTDLNPDEQVEVEVQFASNGDITIKKASKGADFAGIVVISGSLD